MPSHGRTLVSYKVATGLYRELRRVSKEAQRDMTAIVEEALRDWLISHRWLSEDSDDISLDAAARQRRSKSLTRIANLSRRFPDRHPGRSHDAVLYGERE